RTCLADQSKPHKCQRDVNKREGLQRAALVRRDCRHGEQVPADRPPPDCSDSFPECLSALSFTFLHQCPSPPPSSSELSECRLARPSNNFGHDDCESSLPVQPPSRSQ